MNKFLVLLSINLLGLQISCAPAIPTVAQQPTQNAPVIVASEEVGLMITPDPNLQTKDLHVFAEAWNSRDPQLIKGLYSEDARIFSEADLVNLSNNDPIDVSINEELITRITDLMPQDMRMQIIGDPIMVFDKLVAFTYRLQNATEGYNATGLLRYEDEKIFQHVFLVSNTLTSNDAQISEPSVNETIGKMMDTWLRNDLDAAHLLYSKNAAILSDEDLAQVTWRDFTEPPTIDQLLSHFSGWKPVQISPPLQSENMAVFAWRWNIRSYPVAYGVRLVKIQDGVVIIDIRYAIRPWEMNGNRFSTGG